MRVLSLSILFNILSSLLSLKTLTKITKKLSGLLFFLLISYEAVALSIAPSPSPNGNYTLTWTTSSISTYMLYEQFNGGSWSFLGDVTTRYGSYVANGKPEGSYVYRLDVRTCMPMSTAPCQNTNQSATVIVKYPPQIPSSITATPNVATASFTLSWAAASGSPTSYELQQNNTTIYTGTALSKVSSGLTAGQTYTYRVRACNSAGCSDWRTSSANVLPYPIPGIPATISVVPNSSASSMSVSWSSASGYVTRYELQRGSTNVYSGTSTSRTISGLIAGSSYTFRVRACNATGCSTWRTSASTLLPYPIPGIPSFINVTPNSADTSMSVSWGAASGHITQYELERETANIYSGTALSRSVSGLTWGNSYTFRVRACNSTGCSSWRTSGATLLPYPAPSTPGSISTPSITTEGRVIAISWTASTGTLDTYQLERKIDNQFWTQVYAGNALSYSHLASSGPITYRVRACNNGSCSSYRTSQEITVTELANITDTPLILSASNVGTLDYSSVVDHKGELNISIPIAIVPGINNAQPKLEINYSSGRNRQRVNEAIPEDTLGNGWRIAGFSEIRQCRKAPLGEGYADGGPSVGGSTINNIRYCMDGEPLVLATASNTNMQPGSIYHPWKDNSIKVEALGSLGSLYFRVYMPDGATREYGNTNESAVREWQTGNGGSEGRQIQWSINKFTDASGNSVSYQYFKEPAQSANYPVSISYGDNNDAKIEFEYSLRHPEGAPYTPIPNPNTPPAYLEYLEHLENRQLVLLNKVKVNLNNNLVREYRFASVNVGELTQLSQVQLCGLENGQLDCFSPLDIDWHNGGEFLNRPMVARITNGLGAVSEFTFTMMKTTGSAGSFTERPFGNEIVPNALEAKPVTTEESDQILQPVTTRIRRSNGIGGWHITDYAYQGRGLESATNFGFIGFYAQRIIDQQSGIVTYKQFRVDRPYVGNISREIQLNDIYGSHTETLAKTEYEYAYESFIFSTWYGIHKMVVLPYISTQTEFLYESNSPTGVIQAVTAKTFTNQHPTGVTTTNIYAQAANQTNPANTTVWGSVPDYSLTGIGKTEQKSIKLNNRITGTKWLIGFINETEDTYFRGNTSGPIDKSEKREYEPYNATSNLVGTLTAFPGDTEYELVTNYGYNDRGQLVSSSVSGANIPSRNASLEQFVDSRYPGKLINALGHTTQVNYDLRFGSINYAIDPNSRVTQTELDAFGREISVTTPDNVVLSTEYNDCTLASCDLVNGVQPVIRVIKSSPITPTYIHYLDRLGRVIRSEKESFNGALIYEDTEYDAMGRVKRVSNPYYAGETPAYTLYHYDLRNRITTTEHPDGTHSDITYTYQSSNKRVIVSVTQQVKSASGSLLSSQTKTSEFNYLGQLLKTTDAANTSQLVSSSYTYNAVDLPLTATVTASGLPPATNSFTYDQAGNRRTLTDPNFGTITTFYNALHEPRWEQDNKQQITISTYDELGRLIRQDFADGTHAQWAYDTTNGIGKPESRSMSTADYSFTETYRYNNKSQTDRVTTAIVVDGLSRNYQQNFSYDSQGRPLTANMPSGFTTRFNYNSKGYLSALTNNTTGTALKNFNQFNALGQLEQETFGNGVSTARHYNPLTGQLESIQSSKNSQLLQNNTYKWRSNGLMESRINSIQQKEESFTYDELNRLLEAKTHVPGNTSSSTRTLTTNYDLLGNLITKTSTVSNDSQVTNYQYGSHISSDGAGPHAVTSASIKNIHNDISYDLNGNITGYTAASGDSKFIEWSARNLPIRITKGTSLNQTNPTARDSFYYGPDGQRFYKKSTWNDNGQLRTERTFYVGNFEETLPANDTTYANIKKSRLASNVVHIKSTTHLNAVQDTVEYLLADHLCSVEAITDQQGTKLATLAYDPYGERKKENWAGNLTITELNSLVQNLGIRTTRGFTGHEHLNRTGLIHMNGRVYDPQLGRFLSPDPIIQSPFFSQSFNRYSYTFNNPLSYTDPSGYSALSQAASNIPNINMGSVPDEMLVTGHRIAGFDRGDLLNNLSLVNALTSLPPLQVSGYNFSGINAAPLDNVAEISADIGLIRSQPTQVLMLTGHTNQQWVTIVQKGMSRKQCVINGGGCSFKLSANPNANGEAPGYEIGAFSTVNEYSDFIDDIAPNLGVDANLIKSIMYMETTHGYYDSAISWTGLNKSLLPMNINVSYWGDAFGTREMLSDPYMNIIMGASMIRSIQANLPGTATVSRIGTLYNNVNATQVSDYGARVSSIYRNRSWEN